MQIEIKILMKLNSDLLNTNPIKNKNKFSSRVKCLINLQKEGGGEENEGKQRSS